MRKAFIEELVTLAEADERILLLAGDLGYSVVEPFAETFPERFFNVGVAEQNLVGIATGLAEAGFLPFLYSITTFATLRPYEFIRNGPALHQFPVRIVAVGGGAEYGHAGITHLGLEDVGVMRLQPGVTTVAPADTNHARAALRATWDKSGPVYYRIGKNDQLTIPDFGAEFELATLDTLGDGPDVLIVALGSIAAEADRARRLLAEQGVNATLAIVSSVNPSPDAELSALMQKHSLVITVESHYAQGGLGSLVAELIAEREVRCRLIRRGFDAMPVGRSGSEAYFLKLNGLDAASIADSAAAAVREGARS